MFRTALITALFGLCLLGQAEETLITVAEGDTARSLAEKYLGSPDLADSLLNYNLLELGTKLEPGQAMVLPIEELFRTRKAETEARAHLTEAAAQGAEKYAKPEYDKMVASFQQAGKQLQAGLFDRSSMLYKLVAFEAKKVAKQAKDNRRVQSTATVTKLFGSAYALVDAKAGWENIEAGASLPRGARLKTDPGSKLIATLHDGSKVELGPSTEIKLHELVEDRENKQINIRLELIAGDIIGKVTPKKTEKSTFEIKGGDSSLAIRGTHFDLGVGEKVLGLSLHQGDIAMYEGNWPAFSDVLELGFAFLLDLKILTLRPGEGLVKDIGNIGGGLFGGLKKVTVPPSPSIKGTWDGTVVNSGRVDIPIKGKGAWELDIARDASFLNIIATQKGSGTTARTPALPGGTYFFRLVSVEKDNLRGLPSEPGSFTLKPDYSFSLVWQGLQKQTKDSILIDSTASAYPRATDKMGLISQYRMRWDEEPYTELNGPITIPSTVKEGQVDVQAIDSLGKVVYSFSQDIRSDQSPPTLDVEWENKGKAKRFTLKTSDDVGIATTEYSFNNRDWMPYNWPVEVTQIKSMFVFLRTTDLLGKQTTRTFKTSGEK